MSGKRISRSALSRRQFLKALASTAGAVAVPASLSGCFGSDSDPLDYSSSLSAASFNEGIASGDPLADSVIIWTRATLADGADDNASAIIGYAVATDANMNNLVAHGIVNTRPDRDYTVKIDISGLEAGTSYYYQFSAANGVKTSVGTTKTLPEGSVDSVTLAVCSCSNYPAGYFNVYQEIADSSADAVVHLGDYIYEYGTNEYPSSGQVREPSPTTEIIELDDYRERYRQYRSDSNLQAAHAAKPFICVWDDHEVANDTWAEGAENHDEETEGSFSERQEAALQAYHEWLPIRTGAENIEIYRAFDFGDLVRLHILDTRVIARSQQLDYSSFLVPSGDSYALDQTAFITAMTDTSRTLLGDDQSTWLSTSLSTSSATWDVLGQQVLMGRIYIPQELLILLAGLQTASSAEELAAYQAALTSSLTELATIKYRVAVGDPTVTEAETARVDATAPYNLDAWDGYEIARQTLFGMITAAASAKTMNLISLAGDTHNAWASNLYPLDLATLSVDRSNGTIGVEFATPSVSSPGLEEYAGFGSDTTAQASFESAITTLVDDLEYLNSANRGFALVTFTETTASCDWIFVSDITSTSYSVATEKRMQVSAGGNLQLENVELS